MISRRYRFRIQLYILKQKSDKSKNFSQMRIHDDSENMIDGNIFLGVSQGNAGYFITKITNN